MVKGERKKPNSVGIFFVVPQPVLFKKYENCRIFTQISDEERQLETRRKGLACPLELFMQ